MCKHTDAFTKQSSAMSLSQDKAEPSVAGIQLNQPKSVQFPEDDEAMTIIMGYTIARDEITSDECANYWYTKEDYRSIKRNACYSVTRIPMYMEELVGHVAQTYGAIQFVCDSDAYDVVEADAEEMIQDPTDFSGCLETWALKTTQRGLENTMSDALNRERSNEAIQIRYTLLQLYRRGIDSNEIAEWYRVASATTRVFARLFGHADEIASLAAYQETAETF